MASSLTFKDAHNKQDAYYPFPSVTKGPISIQKLKKSHIPFQPYDVKVAFSQMVEFYKQAFYKFPKMRHDIEIEIKKEFLKNNRDKIETFNAFISKKLTEKY
jgi:hypothetical protein